MSDDAKMLEMLQRMFSGDTEKDCPCMNCYEGDRAAWAANRSSQIGGNARNAVLELAAGAKVFAEWAPEAEAYHAPLMRAAHLISEFVAAMCRSIGEDVGPEQLADATAKEQKKAEEVEAELREGLAEAYDSDGKKKPREE